MRQLSIRLLSAAAASVFASGMAFAADKEVTVNVGWNPFAGSTPITAIMIDQKLFEEEAAKYGYEATVEWTQLVGGAPAANAAMVADRLDIDIDFAGSAIVTRIKQDIPTVIFGIHASHLSNAIVVRPGGEIKEFADLQGKTVGLPVGTSAHYTLASILKYQTGKSIEEMNINLVNMPVSEGIKMPAGLDAAGVWVPVRFMGKSLGTAETLGDSSGFAGPANKVPNERFPDVEQAWGYPEGYLVDRLYLSARRAFAKEHPDLLVAFLRARIRAQDIANEDIEKALTRANEEWWKLDPEVAAMARDTYPENTNIRNAPFVLEFDALAIIKASEFFTSIGLIDGPVTWDEVFEVILPPASMQEAAWKDGDSTPTVEQMEAHFTGSNATWPKLTIAGGQPVWMAESTPDWGKRKYKAGPFLVD